MKYIIDVPEEQQHIYDKKDKVLSFLVMAKNATCNIAIDIDAEPYTEPDRKAIEDEVWEFARGLLNYTDDDWEVITNMLLLDIPYQEAKAKYEAWLKQKDKIHVGDEVNPINDTWRGVVVNVDNGDLTIMGSRGISSNGYESKYFSKTGRHFDEVEELLKKMRGEEQ